MTDELKPKQGMISQGGALFRRGRRSGFSLLELFLLVVIVFAFVVIAVQLSLQHRSRVRAKVLAEELIRMEECFQDYYRRYKTAPPSEGLPSAVPAGMDALLKGSVWTQGSAFGGRYEWLSPCPAVWAPKLEKGRATALGAIMLCAFAPDPPLDLDARQLEMVKDYINEVPRLRGTLQTGFNGWPLLIVYPKS